MVFSAKVTMGFIDEQNIGFGVARDGFELKRYDYRITDDGKQILDTLKRTNANLSNGIQVALGRIL